MTRLVRRSTATFAAVVAAAALLPVVAAAPAGAATGCTNEAWPTSPSIPPLPPITTGDGCDDSTPPDTRVIPATAPNAHGLVAVSSMTFTVDGFHTDDDPDPIRIECTLAGPSPLAHDWQACDPTHPDATTATVTYTGLSEAPAGSYVFQARAVDVADDAQSPDWPLNLTTVADTPDLDQTPAKVIWGQDTRAPFVFVSLDAYDEETPTQPVLPGRTAYLRVNSSETGSTLECTDRGVTLPCTSGRWTLKNLASGRHAVTVRAIDKAGNASTWSEVREFYVARNLARRKGWKTVKGKAWLDGNAVTTTRKGARLVLPSTTVGELRLYAATGRTHGTVRVRVGNGAWKRVNLRGPKRARKEFIVLDRYSGVRRGKIVIESLTRRAVILDAVVARPNTFPAH